MLGTSIFIKKVQVPIVNQLYEEKKGMIEVVEYQV